VLSGGSGSTQHSLFKPLLLLLLPMLIPEAQTFSALAIPYSSFCLPENMSEWFSDGSPPIVSLLVLQLPLPSVLILALFLPVNTATVSQNFGPGGGTSSFNFTCPSGSFIAAIQGQEDIGVDAIQLSCTDGTFSPAFGGLGGSASTPSTCQAGFDRFDLQWDSFSMNQILPYCSGSATNTLGGGLGNGPFTTASYSCPGTSVLIGMRGTYDSALYSMQLVCQVVLLSPVTGRSLRTAHVVS